MNPSAAEPICSGVPGFCQRARDQSDSSLLHLSFLGIPFTLSTVLFGTFFMVFLSISTVSFALRCMECTDSPTHSRCSYNTKTCRSGEKCFIQKTEDPHSGTFYTAGCTTVEWCNYMKFKAPILVGKREPLRKHTCDVCCDDADICNRHLCYVPSVADIFHHASTSTGSTTTTTTTTTTTATPISPVTCDKCSGPICGMAAPNSSICTSDKPYCMNKVVNADDGSKQITKGCGSVLECEIKWWRETSGQPVCQTYDLKHIYPFDLTCTYCCTTDDCNVDLVPKPETVYQRHN